MFVFVVFYLGFLTFQFTVKLTTQYFYNSIYLKGVSSSGKTRAFKALDAGSIPATLVQLLLCVSEWFVSLTSLYARSTSYSYLRIVLLLKLTIVNFYNISSKKGTCQNGNGWRCKRHVLKQIGSIPIVLSFRPN